MDTPPKTVLFAITIDHEHIIVSTPGSGRATVLPTVQTWDAIRQLALHSDVPPYAGESSFNIGQTIKEVLVALSDEKVEKT